MKMKVKYINLFNNIDISIVLNKKNVEIGLHLHSVGYLGSIDNNNKR